MTAFLKVRSLVVILGITMTVALSMACGGGDDGGGTVQDGCDRLDECNALPAGVSAGECTEILETDLDNATESIRNDWLSLMEGCLDFDSCATFVPCADQLI